MYSKNLLAIAMLSLSGFAMADDVAMPNSQPAQQEAPAPLKLPPRGSNMSSVEAAYGAPVQRDAAVGQPPITRWEYSNFIVYFEYEHVIHSVVK